MDPPLRSVILPKKLAYKLLDITRDKTKTCKACDNAARCPIRLSMTALTFHVICPSRPTSLLQALSDLRLKIFFQKHPEIYQKLQECLEI